MDKSTFLAAANEYNEDYKENKASQWMPEDGEYLCTGAGFRMNPFSDDPEREPAIFACVRILSHDQYEGRIFEMGYVPVSMADRLGVMFHPETNDVPQNMGELYDALVSTFGGTRERGKSSPTGKVMTVKVSTERNKGRTFRRASIIDYPDVEEAPAEEAPAEEAPAEEAPADNKKK